MQLDELRSIIQGAGGQHFALDYAEELLGKINRIETDNGYGELIKQLRVAKEQGDFRGRVLEVNFANLFVEKSVKLQYGASQGMSGNVDFCWQLNNCQIFIEMKLLGQDLRTKEQINKQLKATGFSETSITDDTRDVARIQRDIFQKSSTTKFNPCPASTWINLVAVDVSELQLSTVDLGDCLLATVGNEVASRYCHHACLRPAIVGVFERWEESSLRTEQIEWVNDFHAILGAEPHPRDYIHGVVFLFREPQERAALCYELSAAVVWNPALVDFQKGKELCKAFNGMLPSRCT